MLFDFLNAVMAGIASGVVVHYICKWLDSFYKSNQPNVRINGIMQKALRTGTSQGFCATMSFDFFLITLYHISNKIQD